MVQHALLRQLCGHRVGSLNLDELADDRHKSVANDNPGLSVVRVRAYVRVNACTSSRG